MVPCPFCKEPCEVGTDWTHNNTGVHKTQTYCQNTDCHALFRLELVDIVRPEHQRREKRD